MYTSMNLFVCVLRGVGGDFFGTCRYMCKLMSLLNFFTNFVFFEKEFFRISYLLLFKKI
jgi:hypothetical protein